MGRQDLQPEDWGWQQRGGKFMPILMDKEAAPANLLEVVCCNCKTGCGSKQCTCRKNGLDCSTGHLAVMYMYCNIYTAGQIYID